MRYTFASLFKSWEFLALLGIIAMGFGLRIWGTTYGLPYIFGNWDEEVFIRNAMGLGAAKSLRPPIVIEYPDLYYYFLFVVYLSYFVIGLLTGTFRNASDFAFSFLVQPGNFHLIGRLTSVFIGALTLVAVYELGKRVFGKRAGLLSTLLLAFSYTHALKSHWATADPLMVLGVTVALFGIYAIMQRGSATNHVVAGILVGLAVATKYNAALLVVPLLMAHILSCRSQGCSLVKTVLSKRLLYAFLAMALSFTLVSPFALLDFEQRYRALTRISAYVTTGRLELYKQIPLLCVVKDLLGTEQTVGFIFILGVLYSLFRHGKEDWLFLSFIIFAFLVVGTARGAALYYMLPAWPVLSLLGGRLLADVLSRLSRLGQWRYRLATAIVLILILLPPGYIIAKNDLYLTRTDTRILTKDWFEENIPKNSKVALSWYFFGPPIISHGSDFITIGTTKYRDPVMEKKLEDFLAKVKTYQIYPFEYKVSKFSEVGLPDTDKVMMNDYYIVGKSLDELKTQGIDYIILSSWVYDRYLRGSPPPLDSPLRPVWDKNKRYFESLFEAEKSGQLTLLKAFTGNSNDGPGPDIKIYRIETRSFSQ